MITATVFFLATHRLGASDGLFSLILDTSQFMVAEHRNILRLVKAAGGDMPG
jgi:hypothetical protein